MAYQMLAQATMVVHFLFLAFLVGGGYVAWRWPRVFWPHLAAAGWGLAATTANLSCPLTALESWGLRLAGGQGLRSGFIDTYIEGVIYPERYAALARGVAAAAVVVSWLGLYLRSRGRRRPELPDELRRRDSREPSHLPGEVGLVGEAGPVRDRGEARST